MLLDYLLPRWSRRVGNCASALRSAVSISAFLFVALSPVLICEGSADQHRLLALMVRRLSRLSAVRYLWYSENETATQAERSILTDLGGHILRRLPISASTASQRYRGRGEPEACLAGHGFAC